MRGRSDVQCSIDGCGNPMLCRSWCEKHYARWRRNGDPLNPGKFAQYATPEESFAARTKRDGDCLVWTATKDPKGYGRMWLDGKLVGAHRYAWERANGPIPEGMQVDHTCYNRACANLDHLRLATNQENRSNLSGAVGGRTLPRGVHKQGRSYIAKVVKSGVPHYLGSFSTAHEAGVAAAAKRAELFGEFAGRS